MPYKKIHPHRQIFSCGQAAAMAFLAALLDLNAENGGFMFMKGKFLIKNLSPRYLLITGSLIIAMMAATCITLVSASIFEITVQDDGNEMVVLSNKSTVGEVLDEAGIVLQPDDIVSVSSDTPISMARTIAIKRALDLSISDIDGTRKVRSAADTVGEVLAQNEITLDSNDELIPGKETPVSSDMHIQITRVDVYEETQQEEIGYETVEENSAELEKGTRKVVTEGANGLADVTYQVVMKNGMEHSRQEISREVVYEPTHEVVAVGTKEATVPVVQLASRGGEVPRASKVIIARATAYDGSYETLGKTNPKTALGQTPVVGTVAVDPNVIPLGTRMYIETVDGSYVYGECFAGDTGGSIKGNRVDLFMGSRAEALQFGSRQVRIYIL